MDNSLNFKPLDAEQRKIYLNAAQVYEAFLSALSDARQYQGGMRWKKTGERDYLFRTRNSRGYGKSLGARSPETEELYVQFHRNKQAAEQRLKELKQAVAKQAKFAVAAGINRMPKIAAQIVRLLEQENLLGKGLMVLGTHSIYAYESAAGVIVESSLMETMDMDLLFQSKRKLKLYGNTRITGLLGLLQKVDRSFTLDGPGHYRASNRSGFVVELVKNHTTPRYSEEADQIGQSVDLKAVEIPGLTWLDNAPVFKKTVIAEDGIPVTLAVPDPRYFALNKLWLSQKPDRDPVKRPRDEMQAKVVARIAIDYLGLSFDPDFLRVFPETIRARIGELTDNPDPDDNESLDMLF